MIFKKNLNACNPIHSLMIAYQFYNVLCVSLQLLQWVKQIFSGSVFFYLFVEDSTNIALINLLADILLSICDNGLQINVNEILKHTNMAMKCVSLVDLFHLHFFYVEWFL